MSGERMYLSDLWGRCVLCANEGCVACRVGVPVPHGFVDECRCGHVRAQHAAGRCGQCGCLWFGEAVKADA